MKKTILILWIFAFTSILNVGADYTETISVTLDGSLEEEPEWRWDIWSILESLKSTAFVLFNYEIKYFMLLVGAVLLWLWWGWRKKKKKQEEFERRGK